MDITVLPKAVAIERTTTVDNPVSFSLRSLFDLVHSEVAITSAPGNGALQAGVDDTLIYTPNSLYVGIEKLEYSVCTTAEPILCDESTITIVVVSTAKTVTSIKLDGAEGEHDSHSETMFSKSSPLVIVGATIGALLALAGTSVYVRRRRSSSSNGHYDDYGPWAVKTAYSADGTEASSLTSEQKRWQRDAQASPGNMSVTAFLTGEALSPASQASQRAFFRDRQSSSSPENAPLATPASPANSLFSSASITSRASYVVDDVVDL